MDAYEILLPEILTCGYTLGRSEAQRILRRDTVCMYILYVHMRSQRFSREDTRDIGGRIQAACNHLLWPRLYPSHTSFTDIITAIAGLHLAHHNAIIIFNCVMKFTSEQQKI